MTFGYRWSLSSPGSFLKKVPFQAAASVEPGTRVPIVYERNGQVLTSFIDGDHVGMLLSGISVQP